MEQLTSCYFCGDAVDAAVEEYPLVRSRTFPDVDADRRIHLCPSCRRKLTQVVEHVLEAAFEGGESEDALAADRLRDVEMTATDVEPAEEGTEPLTAAAPDRDAVSEPDDEGSETATTTAASGAGEATDDAMGTGEPAEGDDEAGSMTVGERDGGTDGGGDSEAERDEAAGAETDRETETDDGQVAGDDDGESDAEAETAFGTAAADSGDSAEATDEGRTGDGSGADSESGRDGDTADAKPAGEGGGETDASAAEQSGRTAVSDSAGDGAAGGERQYANSEFNKVVRLLQNREFPVEIDELVVVAGSAYDIDEPTCHAIVDALIERGVVEDNGEELVRP